MYGNITVKITSELNELHLLCETSLGKNKLVSKIKSICQFLDATDDYSIEQIAPNQYYIHIICKVTGSAMYEFFKQDATYYEPPVLDIENVTDEEGHFFEDYDELYEAVLEPQEDTDTYFFFVYGKSVLSHTSSDGENYELVTPNRGRHFVQL